METNYYKLSEKEKEKLEKIQKITFTNYEMEGNFISIDSIMSALEDLLYEYEEKLDEYKKLENDMQENYKPIEINPYEEYGISESEFH